MSFNCYNSNIPFYNKLSLTRIKNNYMSSACIPHYDENTNRFIDYIKCSDEKTDEKPDYLLIYVPFITKDYITKYYNIKSIDNFIDWVENNNHLSVHYINMIHDMILKLYGNDIKQLNNKVLKYYYQYYKILYPNKFNIKFDEFIKWFPQLFVDIVNDLINKKEKKIINIINKSILDKI